jgi:hypothetical protein
MEKLRYILDAATASDDNKLIRLNCGKLPDDHFKEIKKLLVNFNGKWNTKSSGFIFKTAVASDVLKSLRDGKAVNVFKENQFFYTPREAWDRACELIDISIFDGDRICEPSAGEGHMVKYIEELIKEHDRRNVKITICESAEFNIAILKQKGYKVASTDFLLHKGKYDAIIANPPFNKGQAQAHIRHMFFLLDDGGNVYTFAPKRILDDEVFMSWLKHDVVHFAYGVVEAKYFRKNKANVDTIILTLHKPF